MSFLLKQDGYLVKKDGYLVRATSENCDCCDAGPPAECLECAHCSGCAEAYRPGCPTDICCTPHRIRVVVSGVDASASNCAADNMMGMSVKIDPLPTIDGTFTLTQINSCGWEYRVAASHAIHSHSGTACGGASWNTDNFTNDLVYSLARASTGWYFGIAQGGAWMFGTDIGGCSHQVLFEAEAVDQACDTVPTFTNALNICFNGASGAQYAFADGGTATFTVCP